MIKNELVAEQLGVEKIRSIVNIMMERACQIEKAASLFQADEYENACEQIPPPKVSDQLKEWRYERLFHDGEGRILAYFSILKEEYFERLYQITQGDNIPVIPVSPSQWPLDIRVLLVVSKSRLDDMFLKLSRPLRARDMIEGVASRLAKQEEWKLAVQMVKEASDHSEWGAEWWAEEELISILSRSGSLDIAIYQTGAFYKIREEIEKLVPTKHSIPLEYTMRLLYSAAIADGSNPRSNNLVSYISSALMDISDYPKIIQLGQDESGKFDDVITELCAYFQKRTYYTACHYTACRDDFLQMIGIVRRVEDPFKWPCRDDFLQMIGVVSCVKDPSKRQGARESIQQAITECWNLDKNDWLSIFATIQSLTDKEMKDQWLKDCYRECCRSNRCIGYLDPLSLYSLNKDSSGLSALIELGEPEKRDETLLFLYNQLLTERSIYTPIALVEDLMLPALIRDPAMRSKAIEVLFDAKIREGKQTDAMSIALEYTTGAQERNTLLSKLYQKWQPVDYFASRCILFMKQLFTTFAKLFVYLFFYVFKKEIPISLVSGKQKWARLEARAEKLLSNHTA